jgi:hypothetical protein
MKETEFAKAVDIQESNLFFVFVIFKRAGQSYAPLL